MELSSLGFFGCLWFLSLALKICVFIVVRITEKILCVLVEEESGPHTLRSCNFPIHTLIIFVDISVPYFILLSAEKQIVPCKSTANRFHLNGHTAKFYARTQKLKHLKKHNSIIKGCIHGERKILQQEDPRRRIILAPCVFLIRLKFKGLRLSPGIRIFLVLGTS